MPERNEERDMIEDHEKRLTHMEKTQKEFSQQMHSMQGELENVKSGLTQVENTVLKANTSTQELQRQSNDKVDKVFNILVDLIQSDRQADTQISIARLSTKTKVLGIILGALFGAGGLLSIIQFVFDFIGRF